MTTSSDRLLELSRDLCWRQWTALGVSGVARPESNSVIDLEALILFTGGLGDTDPRLRDEATDWCVQFGSRFISASRLRNLLSAEPAGAKAPISEFLATVNAHANTRWPVTGSTTARHVQLSGKSRLPVPARRPELLRLQLRALFGTTARAEVILAFIASRPTPEPLWSASDLVATGYSKRNIAFILADLALAGLLAERKSGNQLRYRLDKRPHLTKLAPGAAIAILTRWDLRFRALAAARRLLSATETKESGVRSIEARRFITDHSSLWNALDLQPPTPDDPNTYWEDVSTWLDGALAPEHLR